MHEESTMRQCDNDDSVGCGGGGGRQRRGCSFSTPCWVERAEQRKFLHLESTMTTMTTIGGGCRGSGGGPSLQIHNEGKDQSRKCQAPARMGRPWRRVTVTKVKEEKEEEEEEEEEKEAAGAG